MIQEQRAAEMPWPPLPPWAPRADALLLNRLSCELPAPELREFLCSYIQTMEARYEGDPVVEIYVLRCPICTKMCHRRGLESEAFVA